MGAMTVADVVREYRICRSKIYQLLAEGAFTARHVGRSLRIERASIEAWWQSQPLAFGGKA